MDSGRNSGFAPRVATIANGSSVHQRNGPDALALGIGATTSIFTLVDAVLLKSLPVVNPAELYLLGKEPRCCYQGGYSEEKEFSLVSYDLYKYLRDHTQGFSELAAFPSLELLFGDRRSGSSEAAQSYPGEFVSGNYFSMFGITAYAGRALANGDDQPNAPPVAVMSYRLWQEKYGLDPSVIGGVFEVDGKPFGVSKWSCTCVLRATPNR